jgi:hypothetical protein
MFFEGAELFSFRVEPTPSPAGCPTYRIALVSWPALTPLINTNVAVATARSVTICILFF